MARAAGRPVGSEIRQKLIEILFYVKADYGYSLHKLFEYCFYSCTREVVYYHLKKGVSTGEIAIKEVKIESGNYSWGPQARKIMYELGDSAKPMGLPIKDKIEEYKEKNKKRNLN
jgi:hypothetical protein